MTDSFRLLSLPRRPWLDPELLQNTFLERSRLCHPDRVHEAGETERKDAHDRYVALNAAFQQLREPRTRLLHLIELERGHPPADVQEIPHETTDLFMKVGQVSREVDQFLKAHAGHTSAILKAQRLLQAQPLVARLQEVQSILNDWEQHLVEDLKRVDASWDTPPENPDLRLRDLEQLYRLLSYQDRWARQLRERMFLLSTP